MAQHEAATAAPAQTPPFASRIADPGPLGLAGFAGTTFFLSVVNTNMLGSSVQGGVLGLALFYGGIAQLLAGMWEFTKGNTFGALAFASYGAFWLSFWYLINHVVPSLVAEKAGVPDILHGIGVYLLVWAIFTAYMTIASLRTTGAIAAVFVALTVTFVLLAIGAFATGTTATDMTKAGGWAGLVTAALAWYASFAGVTNSTFKRTVLPTYPLS